MKHLRKNYANQVRHEPPRRYPAASGWSTSMLTALLLYKPDALEAIFAKPVLLTSDRSVTGIGEGVCSTAVLGHPTVLGYVSFAALKAMDRSVCMFAADFNIDRPMRCALSLPRRW